MIFEFNEHGVCPEPEIIFKAGDIEFSVAFDGRTWDYGFSISGKSLDGACMGEGSLPSKRGLYVRRETVIKKAIEAVKERLKGYSPDKYHTEFMRFSEGQKEEKQLQLF